MIAGGCAGTWPALYLLHHVDAEIIRAGFGVFLVAYAATMLFRPISLRCGGSPPGRFRAAFVGFGGALIGGLTAMPGALPVIWCDSRGLPREQQRGLVQPYVVAMQLFALTLLLARNGIPKESLTSLALNLPALAAGAGIGVILFRRIDDALFRRAVLLVLLFCGLLLAI